MGAEHFDRCLSVAITYCYSDSYSNGNVYANAFSDLYAYSYVYAYPYSDVYTNAFSNVYTDADADAAGDESSRDRVDWHLRRYVNSLHCNSHLRWQSSCRRNYHVHTERHFCWERSYQRKRRGNERHAHPLWAYI